MSVRTVRASVFWHFLPIMCWSSSLALHKTEVVNSQLVVGCLFSLQINEETHVVTLPHWLFTRSAWMGAQQLKTEHYPNTTALASAVQWWICAKETGQTQDLWPLCSPVPLMMRFVSSNNHAVLWHVLLVPIHPATLCSAHVNEVSSGLNPQEGLTEALFCFGFLPVPVLPQMMRTSCS